MTTKNLINHENGIYIIDRINYRQVKDELIKNHEYEEDRLTDYVIADFIYQTDQNYINSFIKNINYDLYKENIRLDEIGNYRYLLTQNNKTLAELTIENGCYKGYQIIVKTAQTDNNLLKEIYGYELSYDNKILFNIIRKYTTKI